MGKIFAETLEEQCLSEFIYEILGTCFPKLNVTKIEKQLKLVTVHGAYISGREIANKISKNIKD